MAERIQEKESEETRARKKRRKEERGEKESKPPEWLDIFLSFESVSAFPSVSTSLSLSVVSVSLVLVVQCDALFARKTKAIPAPRSLLLPLRLLLLVVLSPLERTEEQKKVVVVSFVVVVVFGFQFVSVCDEVCLERSLPKVGGEPRYQRNGESGN
jgi:hypothetical protein